MPAVAS